jgi:hypothetical protein
VRDVSRGKLSRSLPRKIKGGICGEDGVVVEEADETILWLELLTESGIVPRERCEDLLGEAHELAAIFIASQQTARKVA